MVDKKCNDCKYHEKQNRKKGLNTYEVSCCLLFPCGKHFFLAKTVRGYKAERFCGPDAKLFVAKQKGQSC